LRVPVLRIGVTVEGRLEIRNRGSALVQFDLSQLRRTWAGALETKLESRK
jgi:hypothetical protein